MALIANGQEWSARSLESILTPRGITVLTVFSGEQVLEEARRSRPDLYLLDTDLPGIGGIELCRRLRDEESADATTPLVVTGNAPSTRELRLECLRSGAWEYVILPIDAEELVLKLEIYLAAKQSAEELREACLVDPTTGFYSTRGLLRRAQELGANAERNARALACVVLSPDLAGFRPEETPAKAFTPNQLSQLTTLLSRETRGSDTVGRLGPFEFALLAPETDRRGALRLAQRLAAAAENPPSPAEAAVGLRAGYYAVDDFQAASIAPVELMVRATLALRLSQSEPVGDRIRRFEEGGTHH